MPLSLHRASVVFGAFFLLTTFASASSVDAQTGNQTPPPPATEVIDPTDQQLASFAAATLEVDRLNDEWLDRMEAVEDGNQRQAMRTQALQEMTAAVEDEGLTVEEYNAIVQAVEADPAVAETVNRYRSEMSQ